jgi:hypothetical protein
MDRPKFEVADVFRRYGEAYRQEHGASLSIAQGRVMTAIEVCRTPAPIDTVQNASRLLGLNGSRTVRPNS